ncbi:MAG TPA: hypothetical protein VGC69_03855 [Bordetella sp.]
MAHTAAAPASSGPRLTLGKVSITDSASAALAKAGAEGVFLLARHLYGDWGDCTAKDALQNELAVLLGLRVLSRYALSGTNAIWIITEADRAATTIMAPDLGQAQG